MLLTHCQHSTAVSMADSVNNSTGDVAILKSKYEFNLALHTIQKCGINKVESNGTIITYKWHAIISD